MLQTSICLNSFKNILLNTKETEFLFTLLRAHCKLTFLKRTTQVIYIPQICFHYFNNFVFYHKLTEFIQPLQFIRGKSVKKGTDMDIVFCSPVSPLSSTKEKIKWKIPRVETTQEELVAIRKVLIIGFPNHFDSKAGTDTAPYLA